MSFHSSQPNVYPNQREKETDTDRRTDTDTDTDTITLHGHRCCSQQELAKVEVEVVLPHTNPEALFLDGPRSRCLIAALCCPGQLWIRVSEGPVPASTAAHASVCVC